MPQTVVAMENSISTCWRFLQSKSIKVQHDWLEACIEWITEETGNIPEIDELKNLVYEQWLTADLKEIAEAIFPESLSEIKGNSTLKGNFCVQANYAVDIGHSAYSQLLQITGQEIDNLDDEGEDNVMKEFFNKGVNNKNTMNTTKWKEKSSRMIFFELHDGVQSVEAIEYEAIPNISLDDVSYGGKVLLIGPIRSRDGLLLLTAQNIKFLGGNSEQLIESTSRIKVLNSILKIKDVEDIEVKSKQQHQNNNNATVPLSTTSCGTVTASTLRNVSISTNYAPTSTVNTTSSTSTLKMSSTLSAKSNVLSGNQTSNQQTLTSNMGTVGKNLQTETIKRNEKTVQNKRDLETVHLISTDINENDFFGDDSFVDFEMDRWDLSPTILEQPIKIANQDITREKKPANRNNGTKTSIICKSKKQTNFVTPYKNTDNIKTPETNVILQNTVTIERNTDIGEDFLNDIDILSDAEKQTSVQSLPTKEKKLVSQYLNFESREVNVRNRDCMIPEPNLDDLFNEENEDSQQVVPENISDCILLKEVIHDELPRTELFSIQGWFKRLTSKLDYTTNYRLFAIVTDGSYNIQVLLEDEVLCPLVGYTAEKVSCAVEGKLLYDEKEKIKQALRNAEKSLELNKWKLDFLFDQTEVIYKIVHMTALG